MRNLPQMQHLLQIGPIGQILHHATIIGLEKLPQYQHGEQLRLSEFFLGKRRGIGRQGFLGDFEGNLSQRQRRFGHSSFVLHTCSFDQNLKNTLRISTEQASNKTPQNINISTGNKVFRIVLIEACSVENIVIPAQSLP